MEIKFTKAQLQNHAAGYQKTVLKKLRAYIKDMPKITANSTRKEFNAIDSFLSAPFLLQDILFHIDKLKDAVSKVQRFDGDQIPFKPFAENKTTKARPGTKPVRRTTKTKNLAERRNVVVFPDGFEFKKVTPTYAKKNYKTEMIYGLDPTEGVEGLIETIQDFNYWQNATNILGKEY